MLVRRSDHSEDMLNRAIAATRQLPLPDGPSAEIATQTLAALREAAQQPETTLLQRVRYMPWTSKAIALLATAASLLVVYVGLSIFGGTALAFADVAKVLNEVRSATWKIETEIQAPPKPVNAPEGTTTVISTFPSGPALEVKEANEMIKWTGVGMFLAPSRERTESIVRGEKSINIVDGQKKKSITLVPATKSAIVLRFKNVPPEPGNPFGKTFLGLRQLVADAQGEKNAKAVRLGVKTIDGRRAEGFRIELGAVEVTIWANPETRLPVRVEETTSDGPKVRIVMTDFQVDVELDESLFSLDVPEGYTVQQNVEVDMSKNPLNYLADALKMAAEANDGVFPSELRGENGIDGVLLGAAKERAKDSPANAMKRSTDVAVAVGGAFGLVFSLSPENDWHYAGKNINLNTPDRPIFWYKPVKSKDIYQVLYADLTIKEVPSNEVPKVPQGQEGNKP